ncbi:MAG: DUF4118 domain-containing protein [Chloroflexi bacterium]|nr:DUF4118 domain-containing protein [Chloroflexota bacterium]
MLHLGPWEQRLDTTALLYLAIVVGTAYFGGLRPGVFAAIVAFVTMNQNFVPPVGSVTVTHPGDVIAALAFLGVAGLISQLLNRSRVEAAIARKHEQEAEVIAEMIQVVGSADSFATMLQSVVSWTTRTLGVDGCTVFLASAAGQVEVAAQAGTLQPPGEGEPGGPDLAAVVMLRASPVWVDGATCCHGYLPLLASDKAIGVLWVGTRSRATADYWKHERIWGTLTRQVALVLEREALRADVTEAEILRRSDELKSVLLATVSHELSTPLAVIKAAATSIAQDGMNEQSRMIQELARLIDRETERLYRLVTDLLDLSRIEGGALRLTLGWYDPVGLVQESVARLRPKLEDRELALTVAEDLPPLSVDYLLIDRVIANLIGNAIRYTPSTCPIRIAVRQSGEMIQFTIADDGPGIPPSDLERVFGKFQHVQGRPAGIGLGLAICKGIVDAHGGRIWAESPLDDRRGLAIHFTLPIRSAMGSRLVADGGGTTSGAAVQWAPVSS